MAFTLGGRKGWPGGWSQPAPRIWPAYKHYPPQWIKTEPATDADIAALDAYYGRTAEYDPFTICGKGSRAYSTLKAKDDAAVKGKGFRYTLLYFLRQK